MDLQPTQNTTYIPLIIVFYIAIGANLKKIWQKNKIARVLVY